MSSPQPIQARPVARPSFVNPYQTLPLAVGSNMEHRYWMFRLMHSSNYNDPPQVGVDYYRKRGSI
jgi:cyanobactin biosynthesis protein (PatB/AcyB/McaB family)